MIIYEVNNTQDCNYCGHVKIQKNLLDRLSIERKELEENAFKNMKERLYIQSMHEYMEEILEMKIPQESDPKLMIVTNRENNFGAAMILLPEVYEQLSKKLGEKFIIIPSSIHECLATEYQDDLEMLVNMVKEVNETQVAPEEQLSDHIYLCTKEGVSLLK